MATDFRLKDQLPELTDRIVQTYDEVGTINHLGHCPLPNYDEIIAAIEDLKEILYPGYRRREGLHLGNVPYHVGDLVDGLHDKLTTQIGRALRHDARRHRRLRRATIDFEALGQAKTIAVPGAASRAARRCWPPTCRPPTTATRPASSLDEVIFCYPGPGGDHRLSAWPTCCTSWTCRSSRG